MERKPILDGAHALMKLRRLAYEILEENHGETSIVLAGVHGAGVVVAAKLQGLVQDISGMRVDLITVHLDKRRPDAVTLDREPDMRDSVVILVDDVTNSGRTLLYALKPFLDHHPRKIQTLVLVERSHKTHPIHPDFVGLRLATTLNDHVSVEVRDGEVEGAYLH
jgi:pyrimidine operon attenuation protein/uracil phosphoribosyltransferase